ncbi:MULTISPECIES: methyl-accepting chemotaxis protein [Anaeromyxobacter]|uniref:methyl-accepting chemotaxis protein n=1 Tax=Anaeromyxobacter TaxID=161492 RepID=UPI001F56CD86|nr:MULTISPECIES: methyl-accepting chemotaxis protein [unclassified Anaeromyxobacter]
MRLSMRLKIAGLVGVATGVTAILDTVVFHVLHEEASAAVLARGLGLAIAISLTAAAISYQVARRLTRPLERLRDTAAAIAAGDLARQIDVDATAETADLAASFGAMIEGLQATIAELREAALTLDGRSSDILGSVTRQAAMAAQQAAAINETSTTASEIAQTSKQATQHADSVIEMTRRSDDLSQEGLQTVEEAVKASASLGEQVNRIASSMSGLSERTLQVGEIISSVKDLAEQSNLLALNASIEASKAGEHGRGFAVVAMEMRNLAEQSRQAAVQIRAILQEIQRSARDAASATDEGAKRASAAMGLARSAGEAIEGLAMVIRESAVAARQIANNTRQQTIGVDQMVAAISELSQAINESAEGTRTIEQGTAALSEISKQLASAVQRYRV